MNVIEFHTWNSTDRHIAKPDRMIYDLDPGEGTRWEHIQEAALLVRGFLQQLGLESFLKTSGGKGLHVVVPIAPRLDYETVSGFSKAVVEHLARVIPCRLFAKRSWRDHCNGILGPGPARPRGVDARRLG
jgi:bifunctional non-homologous end joining protein LigD